MGITNWLGLPDIYSGNINPAFAFNDEAIDFHCVFDRTQEDVDRVNYLREVILKHENTEEEWVEYQSDMKGALNYSDLERIEDNLGKLAGWFGIHLHTMMRDPIPRIPYFTNLRKNVKLIRESPYHFYNTPKVPDMPLNTYQKINDIERILWDAYIMYVNNEKAFYYTGNELYTGGNYII